jgi:hypothetical protein
MVAVVSLVALFPAPVVADGFLTLPGMCFPHISSEPTVYVGYVGKTNGAEFSFTNNEDTPVVDVDFGQKYTVQGVLWELMVPSRSCGRIGFVWGVSYLFPFDGDSEETYTFGGGGATAERIWKTSVQWWKWQVALTLDMSPRMVAITGFRYDSFMTNFSNPGLQRGAVGFEADQADVTVAAYIPYMGLMLHNLGARGGLHADFGVIGWPFLWGSFDYREMAAVGGLAGIPGFPVSNNFQSGYFLETFGKCSMEAGCWRLGAFAKFSMIHGSTMVDPGERTAAIPSEDFRVKFDRQTWAVGGNVSIRF